ncbi:hypothetical protein QMK17_13370 [Rhodococcus sp. G-MC3]|uniref:hypothetical protein n=1 Tax=Rhodococcus sp. G-MC3 TaxID=3046209 RepID=UPI0024B8AB06|nr:hypothetical protein [Rhodococcus sp. G-MC3]MDJ0394317.1 hypothetical protein [Rhodococcus sp. G-MC3]
MLEDYAAGLHVDRRADEHDRSTGTLIECQALVGWSSRDDMASLYGDPARIWQSWCTHPPQTVVIESGHHMAEENPSAVAAAIVDFLTAE